VIGPARLCRRVTVLVAACALALGASACATRTDEWAELGVPVTEPGEPAPQPLPDNSTQGVEEILGELAQNVVGAGGLARPVKADCQIRTIIPTFSCTITYLGEVVTYRVTTEKKSTYATTVQTYSWQAEPDALVVTGEGVRGAMWRAYAARASAIRCAADLPDVQRVPRGGTLAQHCWFKPIVEDVAFGRDSSNATRTVQVDIVVQDGRINFREQTQ
jgi:hypothetical protein